MEENAQKDLAIVIVSWNVKALVLKNLEALRQAVVGLSVQVIVVDNASTDGTVETVRASFPEVTVIANTENVGFAKACNQGIEAADRRPQTADQGNSRSTVYSLQSTDRQQPHVLLLNPDMQVEADAVRKTIAYLDMHPEVGVMGAKLIGSDGKTIPHVRRFPTFWDQLATLLKLPHFFPQLLDRYLGKDLDLDKERFVDSVRGSYFAINRTALERLGGLDERYFIWFEEVDYCKQVHAAGLNVAYVPSIIAHDLIGRSFAQRDSYWKQKNFTRSMVTYFKKWHPWWQGTTLAAARMFVLAVAWVLSRV